MLVIMIYVIVFCSLFWVFVKSILNKMDEMKNVNEDKKIKISWWVVEDFTGCRGNVHSVFVNEKDPKNIDKIVLKEFKNKINYDWKIEKE